MIENVTGASGSIGVGRVARAAPDGYTITYAAFVTHVVNGAVYPLQYDVLTDFEPVAFIAGTPWLICAKKDLPANDLKGLIAWLKANPDKASSGTAGPGSPSHLGGILFQNITGTRFQLIPYRGTAPSIPGPGLGLARHGDPRSDHLAAAVPRWPHQDLRRDGEEPHRHRARDSDGGRGGRARPAHLTLASDLGAEGHPEGRHRKAQRRGGACVRILHIP